MIFAQRKQDVDAIHEYLLLKGIEAVAIHGGKGIIIGIRDFVFDEMMIYLDQEERFYAVEKFVKGEKDVLCATDVASKGLDFPDIQHVINYDLPEDIENYGKFYFPLFYFTYFSLKFTELVEQVVVAEVVSLQLLSIKHVVKN